MAQDINHYSSKPKILARSAQNFCNETEEIQTNLFWGSTPANRKRNSQVREKDWQKKSELNA